MPADMELLTEVLQGMKDTYEEAIRGGTYTSLIRSHALINRLHDYVVQELEQRVNPDWIVRDKTVYGFPKTKQQDILVELPEGSPNVSAGPMLAINVRSTLSSIDKNYDTLFERLYAEALNLHNRFPHMPLGYLYLLPKVGYDSDAAKQHQVVLTERYDVEKYLSSFLSITGRASPSDVPWKYERVCLLLVDFEVDPPRVLDDVGQLVAEDLVSEKFSQVYDFADLSVTHFFDDLHKAMLERYYLLGFE